MVKDTAIIEGTSDEYKNFELTFTPVLNWMTKECQTKLPKFQLLTGWTAASKTGHDKDEYTVLLRPQNTTHSGLVDHLTGRERVLGLIDFKANSPEEVKQKFQYILDLLWEEH